MQQNLHGKDEMESCPFWLFSADKTANMSHFYNDIAQSVLQFSGDRIVMEVLTGLFVQVPTHQFIDVKKYLGK